MNAAGAAKTFKWTSICIYLFALLGLASIVFEAPPNQLPRYQYNNISPEGLLRTIIDYMQIISLLILLANTAANYQFNKRLVLASIITYSVFTVIDINEWLFFTNEDILYEFVIAIQASPLAVFLYRSHMFRKEWKGILITGIIAMLIGFISHYAFYHLAVSKGYRGGFYYDYPALMKIIGWFCFTGILFTIVAAMEAINIYLHNKTHQLIMAADNDEQL